MISSTTLAMGAGSPPWAAESVAAAVTSRAGKTPTTGRGASLRLGVRRRLGHLRATDAPGDGRRRRLGGRRGLEAHGRGPRPMTSGCGLDSGCTPRTCSQGSKSPWWPNEMATEREST